MGWTLVLKNSNSRPPSAWEFGPASVGDGAELVCRIHSASICHSGSLCVFQNLPPVCTGSPGAVNCSTTAKFWRDCASVQDEFPADRGSRRRRVFKVEWQS